MPAEPVVVIVGAGPAGLAAAMQLRRCGVAPVVLERDEPGGLLPNAGSVENYPGFPAGIPGWELAALMKEQAARAGVRVTKAEATSLVREGDRILIGSTAGTIRAGAAVIATGTEPRLWTDPKGIAEAADKVLYEIRSIRRARGMRIGIVGAGDAAFDYALTLSAANEVFLMNRGKEARCIPLLRERVRAAPRVVYEEETAVIAIRKENEGGLLLERTGPFGADRFKVDYLVAAIGRDPCLGWTGLSPEPSRGDGRGETFHVIGDAANGDYRQTTIAVGDGVRAAMRIARHLMGRQG
ncbi:MAG: NAD(P)/FAD-dependent oxidoreductase [Candidatus Eisenbacteria bacterium]|nr:NAD(P)/FAD-dependent oxidoreductase [Candidatus Eisenbacteria bacterium]